MTPKLRSLLARVILIGGVAGVASVFAKSAPKDQTLAIRLGSEAVTRVAAVITREGDSEPTAGFSQDFPERSPRFVRHTFSAPNGTYIIVINVDHAPSRPTAPDAPAPTRVETSFERRVSLLGGEVMVSPD